MLIELKEIERNGKRLLKYRQNVANTKHLFQYEYKGLYFSFAKLNGELININNRVLTDTLIKGKKSRGKYISEYIDSSLNMAFNNF